MRVLTGIQPTNNLHIGNLLGALLPAAELQKDHDLVMMIVDYHAITTLKDPAALSENILFAAAAYLGAGIDPEKTILFQQSAVPAHTELGWVMQCITRMGEAQRMTQFKDKSGSGAEKSSVGLFTYPMLMAADILLYQTEGVPVGDDQKQHVELTRDLAERFNRDFGETFMIPKPMIGQGGARIKSLTEPEKKMSKSAASAKSYISLMDEEDIIVKKIRSAVTDSLPGITLDDTRPGLKNILTFFSLITGEGAVELATKYQDAGMKSLKDDLATALIGYLNPIQSRMHEALDHREELKTMLEIGAKRADEIASKTMEEVRKKIGVKL